MQTFLEMGMANTVVATALALVAAAIGLCCRRPAVRHILWLLVLLKLVTPPVLAIPVRLPSALEAALPQDTVTEDLPTFSEEELIGLIAGPLPARTGENQLEATVKDATGKPVDDAEVTVQFVMPAMPTMNMPAMRSDAKLSPAGNGTYRGTGQVMMAGRWDATVTVTRGGQRLGTKQLPVVTR